MSSASLGNDDIQNMDEEYIDQERYEEDLLVDLNSQGMAAFTLPTVEEFANAFIHDMQFLVETLSLCHEYKRMGMGGVNIILSCLRGNFDVDFDISQSIQAVPYLLRAGYSVRVHDTFADSPTGHRCPLTIDFPGKSDSIAKVRSHDAICKKNGYIASPYFYNRSFTFVRARGVIRCIPPLLALLRRARIYLAHPDRSGGQAALAAYVSDFSMLCA